MTIRSAFVAFVSALIVTSMVAVPIAGSASGDVASTNSLGDASGVLASVVPENQVLEATDEVKIWERSLFPLRADTSNAAVSVDNADWRAKLEGLGEKPLNKDSIAVYDVETDITVNFEDGDANWDLDNAGGVQLVAARLEGDQSVALSGVSTLDDLKSLLTQSNANENATFVANESGSLDGDGAVRFTFEPEQPGQYVLFLATTEHGAFHVDDGDISITGKSTILGVEQIAVQRKSSNVNAKGSNFDPGDDITFSAKTNNGAIETTRDENVSQAILLYKESQYTSATFKIVSDSHVNENFDVSENITLQHSIASVNGVQRSVGEPSMFGIQAESGTVDGTPSVQSVLDFLVQNTNLSSSVRPKNESISPYSTLDASLTVVSGEQNEDILVSTKSDWSDGEYRWIHVATNETGTEFAASEGTIELGGPGGESPSDPDRDRGRDRDRSSTVDTPGTTVTTNGNVDVTVRDENGRTSITVSGTTPGTSVNVQRTAGQVQSDLQTQGAALEEMEVDFVGETDFDMEISNTPDKPDPSIPDPPSDRGAVGYINVAHAASDDAVGEVRFSFRVSPERLEARGIDPDEVVLYRYSGGEWTALETEFVGTNDDGSMRFRAVSPGLSVFAIGGQAQQQTEQPTTEQPSETTDEPPERTEPPRGGPPGTTLAEPGGIDTSLVVVIVVIAVVVAAGGLYYRRR